MSIKSRSSLIICVVLLVIAAILPYMFSLGGKFVLDDTELIIKDKAVHSLKNIPDAFAHHFFGGKRISYYYRPIVTVSYMINYAMFGEKVIGYKVTNLLLHLIATLLVFALARRMLKGPAPLLAGLVFAVHPVHTESVAWISGRTDVMAAIFVLAAILAYDRYMAKGNRGWCAASAIFLLAGLLCKEVVIVIPVIIFLMDRFYRKDTRLRSALLRTVPFLVVIAGYVLIRHIVLGNVVHMGMADTPLKARVWESAAILFWYLKVLFIPVSAKPLHDVSTYVSAHPAIAAAGWAGLIGLLLFVYITRRKLGMVTICILWMVLTLIPVLNIIRLPWPVINERFLYLPSVGFSLIIGAMLGWLVSIRPRGLADIWPLVSCIGTTGALLYCVMQTYAGAPLWSSDMALVTKMLEVAPGIEISHAFAGQVYYKMGDYNRSVKENQLALKYVPRDGVARTMLMAAYMKLEDYDSAIKEAKVIIKHSPDDAAIYNEYGIALASTNDYKAAIKAFERAVKLDPKDAKARFNFARALEKDNQIERAIAEYQKGLKIEPGNKRSKRNLELLLKRK